MRSIKSQNVSGFLLPAPTGDPRSGDSCPAGPVGIASAVPYAITRVAEQAAVENADFVGSVSFMIEINGEPHRINGIGALDGIGVRFFEKDQGHEGRDIRIWQICAVPGSGFMAEHAAAL